VSEERDCGNTCAIDIAGEVDGSVGDIYEIIEGRKEGRKEGRQHPMRENDGSIYLTRRVGKSDKNTKSSRQQNIPSLVRREMRMDEWLAAAAAARPDR
jgi:hypothetical protein